MRLSSTRLAGEWNHENQVPATRVSPAYIDSGASKFVFSENDGWISSVSPDGRLTPHITFDPFSKRLIYVLIRGSYGILRSEGGWAGRRIFFSGLMTMIGIDCEWRMTWTKVSDDEFGFVNEERDDSGSWACIDEWRFRRKA